MNSHQYGPPHLTDTQAAFARPLWLGLVAPIIGMFLLGLPKTYADLLLYTPETLEGLARIGLTARAPALYLMSFELLLFSVCMISAIVMVWRRPRDRVVYLVAFVMLSIGVIYTTPLFESGMALGALALVIAICEATQMLFLFVLPDGRFVPRRSWLLAIPLLIARWLIWGQVLLPKYFSVPRTGESFGALRQPLVYFVIFLVFIVGGIAAQVHRYRKLSTAAQRQQIKWVLIGLIGMLLIVIPQALVVNVFGLLDAPGLQLLAVRVAGRTVRQIAFCLVPLSLMLSMMRYRLWDVDVLINRTLVYSAIIGTLALAYIGLIVVLQAVLRAAIGVHSSVPGLVASTLAVALMFEPARQRVQRLVDRRFYRGKFDAERALNEFGSSIQSEVDLDHLKAKLASIVDQTVQPAHVSVWVNRQDGAHALAHHAQENAAT